MKHDLPNLPQPELLPPLDPEFRPAVLASRYYLAQAALDPAGSDIGIAIEQADGSIYHYQTRLVSGAHSLHRASVPHLERICRFLLWSRGGFRLHIAGAPEVAAALRDYYATDACGRFDAQIMGERIYEKPFEIAAVKTLPAERTSSSPLGRHLDGCRIGFDLGGSDRKVAAVIDGQTVFSEETVWDPVRQADPQYHYDGIMDSLRRAAAHLPRVDAIGGSAAGVYVNNRVKVASLFRGIPQPLFESRAKDIFLELQRAWNGVPFVVVNDGEVTALAGSMALGRNAVLGIAMGTSQAGGYVTPEGAITSWLNELAFVPTDYHPSAPVDEWSGDAGCGALYFSQQAVGRLLAPARIVAPAEMTLPEKLKLTQELMAQEDPRAATIYETLGVYLGYAMAHYAEFYPFENVLVLGRVMTGLGGDLILGRARAVLDLEFPELSGRIEFHTPDEKEKRHGQAIAAASLPALTTGT